MSCAKAFLFFFNTIYLGVAAALIYVAVWLIESYGDYAKITTDTYTLVPCGIILGIGVLVFIMAITGCCGTCQNSRCCLSTFFFLLVLVFSLEVAAGVLGAVYKDKAKEAVEDGLENAIKHYTDPGKGFEKAVDTLQKNFDCCGSEGPSDWLKSQYFKKHIFFPASCCKNNHECLTPYQKGCYDALLDVFKEKLNYIIGIGAGFAVLQLLGMIGACFVMCRESEVGYLKLDGGTRV